jgi:hypothetical protein
VMRAHRCFADTNELPMTTRQAIEQVLKGKRRPLRVSAIIAAGPACWPRWRAPGRIEPPTGAFGHLFGLILFNDGQVPL